MVLSRQTDYDRQIATWLILCAVVIFGMILLGGVTRLTNSGLSITEWKPIMGVIPPLSDAAWQEALDKYRQSPEYLQINRGMSMDAFKVIFMYEYLHRVLGRLIGVLFFFPMVYFALRGRVRAGMMPRLWGLFILGGCQGLLGWYMVKSGLVDVPHVSQYRLTAHLGLAVIIYAWMLWLILDLVTGRHPRGRSPHPLAPWGLALVGLVFLMILSGGLVAGTKAGFAYSTWPLMGTSFIPPGLYSGDPAWLDAFEDITAIQFNHRIFAYVLFGLVHVFAWKLWRSGLAQRARVATVLLLLALWLQVILGITTLLQQVALYCCCLPCSMQHMSCSGGKRMYERFQEHLAGQLAEIEAAGLYKHERLITTPQGAHVGVREREVLNLCANNYLGLAQHPEVNAAAAAGLHDWGYGMASVRFICGTQTLHKELESSLSAFLGTEDTILYPSCFDANGGLFETLLGEEDAVISDELNHASIIDGIRLSKAKRFRYRNSDMADLETQLQAADAAGARFKLITTDGVFSMDGYIARLDEICDLAQRYDALVHFDDCHATGFVGVGGRGTHELRGCMDRIDITTGTLGKALGGASGGYTAARQEIVDLLRQRSRPYLFSNTVAPPVVAGAIKAVELVGTEPALRQRLAQNTERFRSGLEAQGFELLPGEHPIVPVMLHDAALAARFAEAMLAQGVYVVAFSFPVVPRGKARIRTQMSAALSDADIDFALEAFGRARAAAERR